MKKIIAMLVTFAFVFAFAGCGVKEDPNVKSEGVMTYNEYANAEQETEIVIETYVQDKQSWSDDKASIYTQDGTGAYFIYEMECSKDDYKKLKKGTKIKVTGYKTEEAEEIRIVDATFEFVDGKYVAEAEDVTALLLTNELINYQNKLVCFKDMTVESAGYDEEGNEISYTYLWDGSGQNGDDLYFYASYDGVTYPFMVESQFCDEKSGVYKDVKKLKIGDTIDMEGFLHWNEGVCPHITLVTKK